MKLEDLNVGDAATIVKVEGGGSLRKRILDLGLTKGCRVKLVRIAPLGDPIELELRGYRLTVRKTEAAVVEVERESGDSAASGSTGLAVKEGAAEAE